MDRLAYRVAYRLTQREFALLAGAPVSRRGRRVTGVALLTGGLLFLGTIAAALVAGVYLTFAYWPQLMAFVGFLLVLLAVALHPRLGKVSKGVYVVDQAQSPALVRLVARVAAELGTRPPDLIVVDERFNASCTAVGLRRTRVLVLGLPLWAALPPQQRVALIAHELGHFVNGDLRNGLVTWLPVNTLGELALLVKPDRHNRIRSVGLIHVLTGLLTNVVLSILHVMLRCGQVLVLWVSLRDGQRAEYLADQMAARVAGTTETMVLLDTLLAGEGLRTAVAAAARRGGRAQQWRAVADNNRAAMADRVDRLRQLSVREEASMFASHPPTGMRARLLQARPRTHPIVVLTDAESDQMDQELAKCYDRAARDLVA